MSPALVRKVVAQPLRLAKTVDDPLGNLCLRQLKLLSQQRLDTTPSDRPLGGQCQDWAQKMVEGGNHETWYLRVRLIGENSFASAKNQEERHPHPTWVICP